jgi:hypothetical protein
MFIYRARVVKTFTYFWTVSLQIGWAHTTIDHKLHGIYLSCSITASASVIKRSLIFKRILFKFGGDIKQIPISYLIRVLMHVLTARTCLHLRICQARDGQWLVYNNCQIIQQYTHVVLHIRRRSCIRRIWSPAYTQALFDHWYLTNSPLLQ